MREVYIMFNFFSCASYVNEKHLYCMYSDPFRFLQLYYIPLGITCMNMLWDRIKWVCVVGCYFRSKYLGSIIWISHIVKFVGAKFLQAWLDKNAKYTSRSIYGVNFETPFILLREFPGLRISIPYLCCWFCLLLFTYFQRFGLINFIPHVSGGAREGTS